MPTDDVHQNGVLMRKWEVMTTFSASKSVIIKCHSV